MTKMILHGCNGRMGQMITGIVKERDDAEIVAGIDIADNITTNGYPVFTDIDACDTEADVVIDFSSAAAVDKLMDYCEKRDLFAEHGMEEVENLRDRLIRSGIPFHISDWHGGDRRSFEAARQAIADEDPAKADAALVRRAEYPENLGRGKPYPKDE